MEYKGINIRIRHDEGLNPREHFDNAGKMICFHSRYSLGDEHSWDVDEFKEYLESDEVLAWLPLYLYDHSGITMNTTGFSCRWDSSQVGAIYITQEGCDKLGYTEKWAKSDWNEGGTFESALEHVLKAEVKEYDQYITGEVYLFEIEETGDCVGGFFGYDHEESGLLDHARSEIDAYLQDKMKTRLKKLKQYITSKVPIIYRELPEVA